MKIYLRKSLRYACLLLAAAAVMAGLLIVWFYGTPCNSTKDSVAKILPFPAALVNNKPVYIKTVLDRVNSATGASKQLTGTDLRNEILNQIIGEKETEIVAGRHDVYVTEKELNDQFTTLRQEMSESSSTEFSALLKQYNLSENEFKNNVLKPELLLTNLQIWFNGQASLNKKQYDIAQTIQETLKSTSSSSTFASLVLKYSQDNNSEYLGGNEGFVAVNNLLPEFKRVLDGTKAGDVVVAPGRYGIYIFQVIAKDNGGEDNSPRVELQQIFLKPSDFNAWYNNQIKDIKIKIFLGS